MDYTRLNYIITIESTLLNNFKEITKELDIIIDDIMIDDNELIIRIYYKD